jgi:hypothetical protein
MADRYWVGGTANWDATAGTKWAATSGGAGGETVPTSADDVFFDALSVLGNCTIATGNTGAKSINCTGFTGTIGGTGNITLSGSVTLVATMTYTHSGTITFNADATITTAGKTFSAVTVDGSGITVQLADALNTATRAVTVTRGTFTTNNFNVTASALSSNNSNTRTINLGSSTVTLSGTTPLNFPTSTNLTFNAGTSQINLGSQQPLFLGGGSTFYNVSFTANTLDPAEVRGAATFNNLSVAARTAIGMNSLVFSGNHTINGTLTLSAGTNATMRTFVRSNTLGTTNTLTCNAVASLQDIDFIDITIAGSAAPVSGTRLGDCKGNSGITFDAAKTVYWNLAGNQNWSATAWALSDGGSPALANFPLAQDTAIFTSTSPASGATTTINAAYNIGTIDMSARTSNTMTLAVGSQRPFIYGNWINGTGTTLTGAGTLTFAGRGTQTITSAGKTFTQAFNIDSPSGSVTLQDAFTTNRSSSSALTLTNGTFNANDYNVTLTGSTSGVDMPSTNVRTIATGSGTWVIAGTGGWSAGTSTNLTVTGTGTISLTSASDKTFSGGGIKTYPTINQGGVGRLRFVGSNKFIGLTNTAIGRIEFTGGTTNEFTTTFDIDGVSGNLLQLGSSNLVQAVLIKPTAWLMGANSTNAGNNIGLSFTAGGDLDYLSVSYINGQVSAPAASNSNFFLMFA